MIMTGDRFRACENGQTLAYAGGLIWNLQAHAQVDPKPLLGRPSAYALRRGCIP